MKSKNAATLLAVAAAALYAINIPLSKLLLKYVDETMMAALLYLGAGIGMYLYNDVRNAVGVSVKKEPLTKKRTSVYRSNGNSRYCSAYTAYVRN